MSVKEMPRNRYVLSKRFSCDMPSQVQLLLDATDKNKSKPIDIGYLFGADDECSDWPSVGEVTEASGVLRWELKALSLCKEFNESDEWRQEAVSLIEGITIAPYSDKPSYRETIEPDINYCPKYRLWFKLRYEQLHALESLGYPRTSIYLKQSDGNKDALAALQKIVDFFANIHLADIGDEFHSADMSCTKYSRSLISSIWWMALNGPSDANSKPYTTECLACKRLLFVTTPPRGSKRQYCDSHCRKWANDHPGEPYDRKPRYKRKGGGI